MFAILHARSGPDKDRNYTLDPSRPAHIGRGTSCEILLTDPMSSRFHAVVFFEDGNWHLRDTSSRNGTLVNGQKADTARLLDKSIITIGETDLQLVEGDTEDVEESSIKQTWIADPDDLKERLQDREVDPINKLAQTEYLLDLYQISLNLMSGSSGVDTIETVLELLRDRTVASGVTLYHETHEGRLVPQSSYPKDSHKRLQLSRRLIRRIQRSSEPMWIDREYDPKVRGEIKAADGKPWSDLIVCPLSIDDNAIGMLAMFRDDSAFDHQHYDFVVAASRLLAIGLIQYQKTHSLAVERAHLAERNAEGPELIGQCDAMTRLKERITRVGRASGSVLIRGESGSGKELVARAVHRASPRADRPMLTVNCAAIPQDLIESQLFGHKKGSFTGADTDHVGWFEQAHTGTLFLDEIGELTLEGQAKLLRILEGHPFLPVGATEQVLVDVRVIAATNRDLAEFVREGHFREDLFYRLSVFELFVPPLRERDSDLDLLIDHFLAHFCRQHGRLKLRLSEDARDRMHEYPWPGNVRQLRNVIDSAVVMADDPMIQADDLGLRDAGISRLDTLRIDEWERRLIRQALEKSDGSVPKAAKMLGISRATAYRKIAEYDIQK
ncbi:sigma 54-interacting transcriptional regulator [Crateriforma conspicua]|uniref:sigma 54-interacting transcriptional regulator n=1 Tax=Crateriforma conspicua TaxID=2527996 RepID=UPI00118C131A|nr:sigma 54-interacting transcriptional regulator [Crateriforma conspicua]QDV61399.1 Nitrogen fixation protein VnfA [Crateriforma conspicua]